MPINRNPRYSIPGLPSSGYEAGNRGSSAFSGLASVVGVSVGSLPSAGGRTETALVTLRSRDFFKTLYDNDEFLGDFFGHKGYSSDLGYQNELYDPKKKVWLGEKPSFAS